ncbi:Hypothetical protein PHPALM_20002 [Phytophthora palmivora]|uniref:Uncharacterized protein n=1 Tax=Phytophthora palmivora TaxID=4796 RepID=A0A2P4XG10_9STRA|nr:Hypothetical protein PHPALM_20002 [Phytophthora palmivora]
MCPNPAAEASTSCRRRCFLQRLLDQAIKANWLRREKWRPILIQQDNAKPHVSPFDPDIVAAGTEGGWNIRLLFQPPNSPDMNCLDLGLSASLQVKQHREVVTGIEGRIESVQSAYMETDDVAQDNIFLTLQACMVCVLRDGDGNQYKIPHMNKAKQRREKKLPVSIICDRDAYDNAVEILRKANRDSLHLFQFSNTN